MNTIQHLPYAIDEKQNINHFYENHWKRVALDLLSAHVSDLSGMSLLDYGCGRGETMVHAAKRGMSVRGLDADPECVRLASQHAPAQVLDLTNPGAQVGQATFDVVACFHVLEHVDNPKQILGMLAKAARHYVIVAVPNLQKIPNLLKPLAYPKQCNKGHLQSWNHAHFQNLAENHCRLRLLAWANDATRIPIVSEIIRRTMGIRVQLMFETGIFRRLFPYWGTSIIALMKPTSIAD